MTGPNVGDTNHKFRLDGVSIFFEQVWTFWLNPKVCSSKEANVLLNVIYHISQQNKEAK
jgi:hypothetical protein